MGLTGHIPQFRPPPVSIVTVDHLTIYHSRNCFFYKPALRIIGEIPGPGGVRDRKGAVEAIQSLAQCHRIVRINKNDVRIQENNVIYIPFN